MPIELEEETHTASTCAAKMGLPIVDADAMGRAFPESQIVTSFGRATNQRCQWQIVRKSDYLLSERWSMVREDCSCCYGCHGWECENMADNIFPEKLLKNAVSAVRYH